MSNEVFSNWKFFPLKSPVGNLLGNGSVTILGTVSVKFKVLTTKAGETFLALPSSAYEKDGEKKYSNEVYILDETTRNNFQKEGVEAWLTNDGATSPTTEKVAKKTGKQLPF